MDKHGAVEMTQMRYEPDRPKAANPIKIQDLTFRDGHQSLFATRGRTEDMVIVAEDMDKVGFYSVEMWGGATFDTMHRYLNEDPWERIRTLKKYMKKTPFSMLLRGQNLVGYRNYADDVVEVFVQKAADNGIDIFRVFDALNDFRNFLTAVKIIKKNNKVFEGAICYSLTEQRMGGEIYNIEYYVRKAKQLEDMGADVIAIKDMAGLIAPYDAYNLVRALKESVKVPVHLHTHFTAGLGDLALFKAIEAGVDIIDTCMAPYAYRTSHPAVEPLVISLLGTNRDTGFDIKLLDKIDKDLEKVIPKYLQFADTTKFSIIDTDVIIHQTPGGMLSNLVNQLREMDALDKLEDVFKEIPRVRKDLGMIPLVTPTSQIVGTQAVNNALFDKTEGEYSRITEQVKDLCYGLYGKTTMPINPEVQKKALKGYSRGEKPITVRPGDVIEPGMPKAEEMSKGLAKSIEDVLIVALYDVTAIRFLKWKYGLLPVPDDVKPVTLEEVQRQEELIRKVKSGEYIVIPKKDNPPKPEDIRQFDIYVDGEYFLVEVNEKIGSSQIVNYEPANKSKVNIPHPTVSSPAPATVVKNTQTINAKPITSANTEEGTPITAPMPGMVVRYEKKKGDSVEIGDTILVLEAMKMYNNIPSPVKGVVISTPLNAGDSVSKGQVLAVIKQ